MSPSRGDARQDSDAVARQVLAYNRRDLDSFLECYTPDAVIENAKGDIVMESRDAMRAAYGELFAESPALHVEIATRIRVGEYVIDEEVVTGRRGSPEAIRVAAIYHLRGDAIDHVRLIR